MKNISHEKYGAKCSKCNGDLMIEITTWSDMKGALYYVFCPCCNIKGDGANNRITALNKFEKAIVHKEKLALRKPEKILTDIRDYLVTEKGRVANSDIYLLQIQAVENFADKALADLTEYAEKLGVEL